MDAYYLPNGIRLHVEHIIEAVLATQEYPQIYLDTETGALVEIPSVESLQRWIEEIGSTKRYFLIPCFEDKERTEMARDFVSELLPSLALSSVCKKAQEALQNGGWRELEDFFQKDTDGWIHAWTQFLWNEAAEYVDKWLTENPHVPVKTVFEGCENCAACELVRQEEGGNLPKLLEAFETQNFIQDVENQMKEQAKILQSRNQKNQAFVQKAKEKQSAIPQKVKKKRPQEESLKVFVFKITLNDSSPRVWRRVAVPANYTFFDLHCAIQNAIGWEDSHLHMFRIDTRVKKKDRQMGARGEYVVIEFPNPEMDDRNKASEDRDERTEYIADWFPERIKQCLYEYDFGDNWTHTVLFEKELDRDAKQKYPQCTTGKNACPPEDCGGVWGYRELQDVLKNSTHEEHKDMLDWLGVERAEDFDPSRFDPKKIVFDDPRKRLRAFERGFGVSR